MQSYAKHFCLLLIVVCSLSRNGFAQRTGTPPVTIDGSGRPVNPSRMKTDSVRHRDQSEDSITIYYRFFDSTRIHFLDSTINDFSRRYPLPYYYESNGTLGNAARSYLFDPAIKPGFDHGFHAYDIYRFKIEETRIFQTTRPFTELGYLLGSKAEQMIHVTHTQNRRSNLNFGFEYRFINAPGAFRNQFASHNNFRFHTYYNSLNRRYSIYFIFQSNRLRSSENGGVVDETKMTQLAFDDPFELETRLGNGNRFNRSPFISIKTGNDYKDNSFVIRQQYDLGQKDSIVTDSTTVKLFYPRIRLQHTFTYTSAKYHFKDYSGSGYNGPDSASYHDYLFYTIFPKQDSLEFSDRWRVFNNEVSIISYPQKNNLNQFLKLGAALQNIRGEYQQMTEHLYNVIGVAEYRNRTRNQVWDVEASGQLYLNGYNAGDYTAQFSLKRVLGKKIGSLELGVQNTNKTPAAIFTGRTSFPMRTSSSFNKENQARFFARYENAKLGLRLTGRYHIISNYIYLDSFYHAKQESALFNILHVAAEKRFRISRNFHWYTEVHLQQATGNAPVHLPLLFTRNRVVFEGNLGFRNLDLATGLEVRYHSPYKADNYSPLNGQFVFQDTTTIRNNPQVSIFLHFRIKSFKAFARLENLNTLGNHYNLVSNHYPSMSLWFRLGIWWGFVN